LNTSQQVGGAIGVAVATTIATTATSHFVSDHPGATPLGDAALTHGFQIAFYALAAVALAGAFVAALLTERRPAVTEQVPVDEVPLMEAA